MAYPSSFLRLVMKWELPGSEVAFSQLAWQADDDIVSLDDATAGALAGQAEDCWGTLKANYASETAYVGCSVLWVNTDGSLLSRIDVPLAPIPGTDSDFPLPNEVAIVASMRTAVNTRRTRGRMYWPPQSIGAITSDARYSSSRCTAFAEHIADLCRDVTVGLVTYQSVVASATGGLFTPIIEVAVGDVPDSQRGRRDRLSEGYSVSAVP